MQPRMRSVYQRGFLLVLAACGGAFLLAGCGTGKPTDELPKSTSGNGNGHAATDLGSQLGAQKEPYGQTADGQPVERYLLSNAKGVKLDVINYGAAVTSLSVPDSRGKSENITLGYADLAGYEKNDPYFGGICGRYANRIAGGKFKLGDKEFTLAANDGPNHLHGGKRGFNHALWHMEPFENPDDGIVGVKLSYTSPDGEEGYPGTLKTTVAYTLTNDNEFRIDYEAVCDKATPVNLTSHCYWNLAGEGDVLGHELTLNCDQYLPVDDTLIPTGERKDVKDTPMDFTKPATIGARIAQVPGGYDHCYIVNSNGPSITDADGTRLSLVARVREPKSGRAMEIYSTEPGVQLYSGNFLDGKESSGDFDKHQGFCLECQHFPDSPNQPDFPNTILEPGQVYRQRTIHRFSAAE